jgi:hypothetical protein
MFSVARGFLALKARPFGFELGRSHVGHLAWATGCDPARLEWMPIDFSLFTGEFIFG